MATTLSVYADKVVLESGSSTATLDGPTARARFRGYLHANFYVEVGEPVKYPNRTVYFYTKGLHSGVGNGHHQGA